jgi:hypothetical protein
LGITLLHYTKEHKWKKTMSSALFASVEKCLGTIKVCTHVRDLSISGKLSILCARRGLSTHLRQLLNLGDTARQRGLLYVHSSIKSDLNG